MLKFTADSITPSLTVLFNMSISTGVFPSEWKVGRIVPVPKGSNKASPSGYRPISILPVIIKVLECHLINIIEDHLRTFQSRQGNGDSCPHAQLYLHSLMLYITARRLLTKDTNSALCSLI